MTNELERGASILPSYSVPFQQAVQSAAELFLSHIRGTVHGAQAAGTERSSTLVRVISHYDGDGISAAGIICSMLTRLGVPFHATLIRGLDGTAFDRLRAENNEVWIFADMGSGQLEDIENLLGNIIILDHHVPIREAASLHQINCHFFNVDGMLEASASTLAFLFALAVSDSNWDLAPFALAGAIADKQHLGGFKGLNKELLEAYIAQGYITHSKRLSLTGETVKDAILYSIAPYFTGLSGYENRVDALLERFRINGQLSLTALGDRDQRLLGSYLILQLLKQGAPPFISEDLVGERYWCMNEKLDAEMLADLLDASGHLNNKGLGLALCLGDSSAREEAMQLYFRYRREIIDTLRQVVAEGLKLGRSIQYFDTVKPDIASSVAGIGMQYIFDQSRPVFALTEMNERLKISGRGTRALVAQGLDLAAGLRIVGEELGGVGGGHPIAAGATIQKAQRDAFLGRIDEVVGGQMKKQE